MCHVRAHYPVFAHRSISIFGVMLNGGQASWESALTTGEFAAIRLAGFVPVGRVVGAAAYSIGAYEGDECPGPLGGGFRERGYGTSRTLVGSLGDQDGGFGRLACALDEARRRAIGHLAGECVALGGHGVIGARLTADELPEGGGVAFTLVGTAVRGPGAPTLERPFTACLSGQDFARLLAKGWVPAGLVLGIAVGARHDDTTADETRKDAGNTEVGGYTHLISATGHDARRELARDVRRTGAEGVVIASIERRVRFRECPATANARDHIAEVVITGTAITRFSGAREGCSPALAILPLDPQRRRPARDVADGHRILPPKEPKDPKEAAGQGWARPDAGERKTDSKPSDRAGPR